jgi:hypothetical protein
VIPELCIPVANIGLVANERGIGSFMNDVVILFEKLPQASSIGMSFINAVIAFFLPFICKEMSPGRMMNKEKMKGISGLLGRKA